MSNIDFTLNEVASIVDELNECMPESVLEEGLIPLSMTYATWCGPVVIAFGEVVWSEETYCGDDIQDLEDLKSYLIRVLVKFCTGILEGLDSEEERTP